MQTEIKYTEVICDRCGEQVDVPSCHDITKLLRHRGWEHIEFHTANHINPRDYCRGCKNKKFAKQNRSMFDSDFSKIDGKATI